jgi:beta propeller repeat protein
MGNRKKLYSMALASVALILFLILVLSTASAASPTITETRITTNSFDSDNPVIYGNNIVWQDKRNGNWDIYIYNLSTRKETCTTNLSDQTHPDIYGNTVVWEDKRNGNSDIYMQDISTNKQTRITTNKSNQCSPVIYGTKIVWEDGRHGGTLDENGNYIENWNLYMYDLSTKKEIQIITSGPAICPDIFGNRIVWQDSRRGGNIYMYDLSTQKETQITTSGFAYSPAIYSNKIVWEDDRNGNYDNHDIYMYDLSTEKETQITASGYAWEPDIYGDRIVYQDNRNDASGNTDIFMYNLSTHEETLITPWEEYQGDDPDYEASDPYQENPAIYNNRIVWADGYQGSYDIYMGTLSYGSSLPTADFSASTTSGNAPLKVTFTDKSTGSPTAWKWSFGDGSALVTQYNPTYTYTKPGTYTVKETVSNAAGKDTEIKTNYITVKAAPVKPVASFTASPVSGKAPLKVQFTDKSTNNPTAWKWSFGDKTYSTAKNPAHKYTKAGKYTVSLTVKNAKGSSTKTIARYIVVSKK